MRLSAWLCPRQTTRSITALDMNSQLLAVQKLLQTTQRTLGVGNPTVVKLRDDQFSHLRSTWTAMTPTVEEATQTLETLGNLSGVFTDEQLQVLATF